MKVDISFILPIYNVESYLAEAIESILKQNISKEIILVDDGSTDNSLNIALSYAKKYSFVYVIHSQNKGVGAARNAGLRMAQGESVFFIDPDDTLDSNLDLNYIFQLMEYYDVPVIKGQFTNYYEREPEVIYYNTPANEIENENTIAIQPLYTLWGKILNHSWFTPNACFLLNRQFLLENQLHFSEELTVGEDGLFNIDLFMCEGKALEVANIFFNYRMNDKSVMGQAISHKRLSSLYRCIELIQERKDKTENETLKYLLDATQALHCFSFYRDIEQAQPEIKEGFEKQLTPELIENYQRFNVKESTKEPNNS